jgi:predicted Zn-dependent protease
MRIDLQLVYLIWACLVAGPAAALPIAPTRDDEVVEVLPAAGSGSRAEEKRLRRELARRPDDARLAVDVARRHLDQAREQGDARFVGLAFAALQRWSDPAADPPPVVLMQAVLLQYQHDFDRAGALLEQLLQRQPKDAQAWLTLATVRRVQGRYAESDAACRSLPAAAPDLYPRACMAENASLRGRVDEARSTFHELLARPGLDLATRGWLLTSLAELEERAGRAAAAGGEWRAALRADPGPYTALGYADFLIAGGQPQTALV